MKLSKFYKDNPVVKGDTVYCRVKDQIMTLEQYSATKGVRGANLAHKDDDRSICQMSRNANGLSSFRHHTNFIYIINYANNVSRRLLEYKNDFTGKWGEPRRRSDFTEEKRNAGRYFLDNPHHSIFELLAEVRDQEEQPEIKSYIEEIAYYFERINSKILSYEKSL